MEKNKIPNYFSNQLFTCLPPDLPEDVMFLCAQYLNQCCSQCGFVWFDLDWYYKENDKQKIPLHGPCFEFLASLKWMVLANKKSREILQEIKLCAKSSRIEIERTQLVAKEQKRNEMYLKLMQELNKKKMKYIDFLFQILQVMDTKEVTEHWLNFITPRLLPASTQLNQIWRKKFLQDHDVFSPNGSVDHVIHHEKIFNQLSTPFQETFCVLVFSRVFKNFNLIFEND